MMNIIALGLLLSSLGSVMVLTPDGEGPLAAARDATVGTVNTAADYAKYAGEGIADAAGAATDSAKAKVGWFRKKVLPQPAKPEDHLAVAREKAAAAKDEFLEASSQLKDAAMEKLGSTATSAKKKAGGAYMETGRFAGGKASQAAGAVTNAAGKAAGWVGDGAHYAYDGVSNTAGAAKDAAYNAAAAAGDKTRSTILSAGHNLREGTGDAYESAADTLESAKEKSYEKFGEARATTFETAENLKNKAADSVGDFEEEAYDVGHKAAEKVTSAAGSAKDTAYTTAENAKDRVHDTAASARDTVVENAHLGVDKSKGTAIDAAEKVKETGDIVGHGAKDAGLGLIGKVKEAACKTAECLRLRAQEAGSFLPNVGQGVGYAYVNDVKDVKAANVKGAVKDGAHHAADYVADTSQQAKARVKEGAESTVNTAKQAYDGTKEKASEYYEGAKDRTGENYDSAKETLREYYDEAGRRYKSARDYYDGFDGGAPPRSRGGGGRRHRGVRHVPLSSSYFDDRARNAGEEEYEDYNSEVKDHARRTYRASRDWAGEYSEEIRDKFSGGGSSPRGDRGGDDHFTAARRRVASEFDDGRERGRGGGYYDGARRRVSQYYENARDRSGDYYEGAKQRGGNLYRSVRDTAEDLYESSSANKGQQQQQQGHQGINDLEAVVESMGWRRVGEVHPRKHDATTRGAPSSESPEEIIIGNVKYSKPAADGVFNRMSNTVKGAAQTVGERLGLARDRERDAPGNNFRAKEEMAERLRKAEENVRGAREFTQRYSSPRMHHAKDSLWGAREQATRRDRRSEPQQGRFWGHRDFEGGDEDDYEEDETSTPADDQNILSKGAENLKQGIRRASREYESQRSKAGEYADAARREIKGIAGYGEEDDTEEGYEHEQDNVTSEGKSPARTWKHMFLRRPMGFLLGLTRLLHLFTFSTIYGSAFWVTFVSGLILSKNIPRQQFGYVQSRMFPVYLRVLAAGEGFLFILHSLMHPWFSAEIGERWQLQNFLLMIVATLVNVYVLEPRATKVMFERLKVEKEEGRALDDTLSPADAKQAHEDHKKKLGTINQQFKVLHGYSSALNLVSLAGLTWHLWHLARHLVI